MKEGNDMLKLHRDIIIVMAFLLLAPGAARAHRVSVFAWVEGDVAHVEGKFAGGNPVKGGEVIVKGPGGKTLITGETDDQGAFSFQIPQKSDLKVVISAGMGHQGDWTIRAGEIETVSGDRPEMPAETARPVARETTRESVEASSSEHGRPDAVAPGQIQAAVEKALDKKLKPVIRMLADERRAVSATEIFGGIGYIFGLVGVAAYVASRRKTASGGKGSGNKHPGDKHQ